MITMPVPEPFIATTDFYVRYAETDAQGIVHHSAYIVWFEEARSHYARARGTNYAEFERAGYWLSVASVQARYSHPARYGDRVAVRCWVEASGSRAVTFRYEINHADSKIRFVTGESRHICVNREGQPVIIPAEWRYLLGGK
jgi:acyl-CoA thioester hydrolase